MLEKHKTANSVEINLNLFFIVLYFISGTNLKKYYNDAKYLLFTSSQFIILKNAFI